MLILTLETDSQEVTYTVTNDAVKHLGKIELGNHNERHLLKAEWFWFPDRKNGTYSTE